MNTGHTTIQEIQAAKAICITLYLIIGIVCCAYYSQRLPSVEEARNGNAARHFGYLQASIWSIPAWPVVLVFHAAVELTAPEEATNDH